MLQQLRQLQLMTSKKILKLINHHLWGVGSDMRFKSYLHLSLCPPVSCSLPERESDLLEQLQYVELPQEKALKLLQEYKDEAHRLLPPNPKPEKKARLNKKRPHGYGPPASHRMQWTGSNGQGNNMTHCVLFWDTWPFEMEVWSLFLFGLCRLEQLKSIMEAAAILCKWCEIPQKLFISGALTRSSCSGHPDRNMAQ